MACVTTGPGGTNAITGVLGQWHDSVPALYVSGQVRFDTTVASTDLPLRQLGDQEADIVRLVAPITKYAACIVDPATARYHVEKAIWLATHGRHGPVWLDVPLNVQAAQIEPERLAEFGPAESTDGQDGRGAGDGESRGELACAAPRPRVAPAPQAPGAFCGRFDREAAGAAARETLDRLRAAERPVILAGSAVRAAGDYELFLDAVDALGVPVCTAWNAADLLWDDCLRASS